MKTQSILICTVGLFLFSCQKTNVKENQPPPEPEAMETKIKVQKVSLPNLNLDSEKFGEAGIRNGKVLSAEEIKNLGLDRMDAEVTKRISDYPDIKYFLLKDSHSGENGSVKLLSRTYEMENQAWMATYDKSNQLVDFLLVFYDEFAESAHQIETKIQNDEIVITEHQLNFETDKENITSVTYEINNDLKFQKITPKN